MADSHTLSNAPLEHPALDYAFLRREGIRHLEELAGKLWTDFNTHDPGITILEQLCYAISDLAYRASHAVPDLLASGSEDANSSLYSASAILTSHPVTLLDLRKLIVDVDGVKNAWVEEIAEPRLPLHYHDDKHELRLRPALPYTTPTRIQGLVRVMIETSDLRDRSGAEVQREVARRLHAARPLCADFDEIQVLAPQPIQAAVTVEIGPVDDAERVLLDIHQVLAEYIAPTVQFHTLGEMLAAGWRSDEIFDGPALAHGFVDTAALARMRRRTAIQTSDLIREIMGISGVRAVLRIGVSANGTDYEPWVLPLDKARAPRLDHAGSSITLMRGRIAARLDAPRVVDALARRSQRPQHPRLLPGDRDFLPAVSRGRNIAQYRSIQHDLPVLYGVGPGGTPASASPRRRAQARQLKAYLLFFDQLLAGFFAELAHAGDLFSFHTDDPRLSVVQAVDDAALDLDAVRRSSGEAHRHRLSEIAEALTPTAARSARTNRIYNHLMARFAEQFTDYSLVLLGANGQGTGDERLVPDKQAFLRRYPRISSARGTGRDVLAARGGEVAGLQERIERKLGLTDDERFILIEHLALAPIREDDVPPGKLDYQQKPVLVDCPLPDPYSLQLSFVLPATRGRLRVAEDQINELRQLIEYTIREETPAHLTTYIRWLDEAAWTPFAAAYAAWLDAYAAYRAERLGLQRIGEPRWLRMRDARDHLIDLLGLGETYPLRDLPVRDERLTVPFKRVAQIPINHSQPGVIYRLIGAGDQVLAEAAGTGETIALTTPPMQEDTTFNILARKPASGREAYLVQQATVKVGLDVTLRARILDAELLVPDEPPGDGDVRIVPWATAVRVQVDHSQEGVDYRLVRVADGKELAMSPTVRGDLGDIVLATDPIGWDIVLRVRATKVFDASEHRQTQTELLDAVLPLAVRARPGLPVALDPSPIVAYDSVATVRIDESQVSVEYQVFVRAARDSEYVFGGGGPGLLAVDVDGGGRVQVRRPPTSVLWQDIERFKPGGAPTRGNGGALRIPVPGLLDDSVILVRAAKQHSQGDAVVPSAVQLAQAALVLVRPNPRPVLRLGVVVAGTQTTGTLDFVGGQPGVFYQARREPGGATVGLPAYFPKTDELDPAQNKGFDQIRLGVDFVITGGPERKATTRAELMTTRPLAPRVLTGALDTGVALSFLAIKAMSRVAVPLDLTAKILPLPKIEAPMSVTKGQVANIVVRASVTGDRYQLTRDGKPIGAARDGDGKDLTLPSDALQATSRFIVSVTRPADAAIPVTRSVVVDVGVV